MPIFVGRGVGVGDMISGKRAGCAKGKGLKIVNLDFFLVILGREDILLGKLGDIQRDCWVFDCERGGGGRSARSSFYCIKVLLVEEGAKQSLSKRHGLVSWERSGVTP